MKKINKANAILDLIDKGVDVLEKGTPVVEKAGNVALDLADRAIECGEKLVDKITDIPFKPIRKAQQLFNKKNLSKEECDKNLKKELNKTIGYIKNVEIQSSLINSLKNNISSNSYAISNFNNKISIHDKRIFSLENTVSNHNKRISHWKVMLTYIVAKFQILIIL